MCSLCQILIRFFLVYVFLVQSTSFSKKSPTLADYLFSLHFFESVIVGQILTLCWNPQLPVKFPFSLLHLHFLFVTTNKNTIFRGKSPYFWWLPRRNHHFFLLMLGESECFTREIPIFFRWKQTMPRRWCRRRASRRPGGKKSSKWIHGIVIISMGISGS